MHMPVYTDDLGRRVDIPLKPQRIVSVVPSQTELLYDLGLDQEVAGITKFCVHPAQWFRNKTRIGGTKKLDLEKIISLQPDLVIANKEENVQEQVEALAQHCPVWVSDVNNLEQALQMIESIGQITGKVPEATSLKTHIEQAFASLKNTTSYPLSRVCYLIWKDPYMTVGGDTFISHLLQQAGFENLYRHQTRYPILELSDLQQLDGELLLLSSEPYPFAQKHLAELQALLPQTKIALVDGEMFSWYGSRLQRAPAYFRRLQQQLAAV